MRFIRPLAAVCLCLGLTSTAGAGPDRPLDAEVTDRDQPSLRLLEVPRLIVSDQDIEIGYADLYAARPHPRVVIDPQVVSVTDDGVQRTYVARLDNVKFPEKRAALDGSGSAGGTVDDAPADPSEDLSARVAELQAQLAKYRAASTSGEKRALIFSMLATLTWLMLAGFKRAADLSTAAKRWLPRAALFAGVAAGLFAKLGMGEPWLVAILYGAGPGLAVLIQELVAGWTKPKDPA